MAFVKLFFYKGLKLIQNKTHILFILLLIFCSQISCEQPKLQAKNIPEPKVQKTEKEKVSSINKATKVLPVGESIPSLLAGKFYPADKDALISQLNTYIKRAKKIYLSDIWGLVAPHAGYKYSALIQAAAYKQVWHKPIKTVVLVAFSHNPQNPDGSLKQKGIATTLAPSFTTPLGEIGVDLEEVQKIIDGYPFIQRSRELFLSEHSLEAQLPFIQKALPTAKIVPLMFGAEADVKQAKMLGAMLAERYALRGDCLVVATTDMSHYHSYDKANAMDGRALKLVTTLKTDELKQANDEGSIQFCGLYPLLSLMYAQKKFSLKAPTILEYKNSGDTTGKKEEVVGYSAIAFARPVLKKMKNIEKTKGVTMEYTLTDDQKKSLLKLARETVESYVKNRVKPEFEIDDPMLLDKGAAFVTLEKNNRLRGCIGHTEARLPLWQCVRDMAIAAATQDPRFPPVSEDELDKLSFEISVLTPMKKVDSVENIQVGRDGLMMEKGFYRGLLLPQVPVEWGWNREKFLDHTAEKAGLPQNAWRDGSVTIYSFQGLVFNDEELK